MDIGIDTYRLRERESERVRERDIGIKIEIGRK